MKNINYHGWLIRGLKRKLRLGPAVGLMFAALAVTGCGWFQNSTNPPMIIDASQHPVGYGQQQPPSYNDPRYAQPANTAQGQGQYAATSPYDRPAPAQQNYNAYPPAPGSSGQAAQSYPAPATSRQLIQPPTAQPVYQNNQPTYSEAVPATTQPSASSYVAQSRHYAQPQPATDPGYYPTDAPTVTDVRISEVDRKAAVQIPPAASTSVIPAAQSQTIHARQQSSVAPQSQSPDSFSRTPAQSPQVAITGLTPGNSQASPIVPAPSAAPTSSVAPVAPAAPPTVSPTRGNPPIQEIPQLTDAGEPILGSAVPPNSSPAAKILACPTPEPIQSAPTMPTVQPVVSQQAQSAPAISPLPPAPVAEPVDIRTIQTMLEKYLKQQPKDTNVQLALRYLYQAQGLTDKAAEPLKDIPVEQQAEALQLAKTFLLAQQACAKTSSDNPILISEALQSLNQLQNRLVENADLEIVNLKMCQGAAKGFGQYEPIDAAELEAGKTKTIWIYFELQNFQTRVDEKGKYSSRVGAEITLYDDQFRMVKQLLQAEVPDESWNRRKDFYLHAGPLKLPDLPPGDYQLIVNVEDKIAKKAARPARLDFKIKPTSK